MIKIQLAPAEELENKHWYVPDLTLCVVVCLFSYLGVDQHLKHMEETIALYKEEKEKTIKNTERLSSDLVRYETMNQNISDLENKILSLKSITVSKMEKYKPIILMEHLQTLKPEGVWFESFIDHTDEHYIQLKAGAYNHELVAQFMSNLLKTKDFEPDSKNLKTLIYFPQINLERSAFPDAREESKDSQKNENEKVTQAFQSVSDKIGGDTKESVSSDTSLSGFESFPRFEMEIQYEERKPKHIEHTSEDKKTDS